MEKRSNPNYISSLPVFQAKPLDRYLFELGFCRKSIQVTCIADEAMDNLSIPDMQVFLKAAIEKIDSLLENLTPSSTWNQ